MEFNVEPYNDDFIENAKDNNYLRILFKPGFAVQARELTQIQSILQNQIKSFGDHIFQDGSPVIGGNLSLDNNVTYLKLDETYNNEDIELDLFVGEIILRDSDSLVQAKVLASYFPSGGTPTLLVKYLSGVDFSDGDVFKIAGTTTRAKCIDSSASGKGTIVSINDGIFYVDGYFVTISPQTAVVSAYGQNANVKIGLEVGNDVVDYAVDSTLLDPAQDSFNYQAPGADRYQFSLNLSTRPLDTAIDESKFFELMRLENGAITKQIKYPIYSEIEKTLARRTFDESGDYTVTPFRASVSESYDDNKYIINIEPGKAYVKGFEFETIGTFRMEVNKPRTVGIDTRSMVDIDFDTSYGNYLKLKNVWGSNSSSFLDTDVLESVDLHCTHAANVAAGVGSIGANNFTYSNTKIGTARIRNVSRDIPAQEGGTDDSNGVFNMYLTDVSIAPRLFRLEANGGAANTITLPTHASTAEGAYDNVSITVLPILLTSVANVNVANVFINSTRVNANSAVANVFNGNVAVGAIIRVGEETRQVVRVNTTGDYLIVNTAFTKTVIGTNSLSNPLSVFVQSDYSSNVTNQSRTILSYNGSSKVATLDRPFDDSARVITNTIVQLDFAIKDIESLMDANVTYLVAGDGQKHANAHANIAIQSLLINGDAEMFEPSRKQLIFPLPRSTVKRASLNNVDYTHTKYSQLTGAAGVFTLSVETWESIPWSITNSNIEDNLIAVVRESSTLANGSIVKLTTSEVAPSGSGLQITLASTVAKIDVYCNVKENDTEDRIRTKTYRSNPNLTVSPFNYPLDTGVTNEYTVNVPNVGNVAKINVANGLIFITDPIMTQVFPGDAIKLYVPDVVNIRRILAGNTTSVATATNYEDITDHFVIDLGQTDELYDHAKIILKQGYPSPNCMLTIHADFYDHTYPAGASFFSVDSYSTAIYEDGAIPIYYSTLGNVYFLRDCLDFRPTRRIGLADDTLDVGILPNADAATELSFDYYLPRIDKLVLSKTKEFRVIKGISSPTPIPPDDNEDSMTLYTIYLPPFVATVNDVRLKYVDNRRYTMKDISEIDKRIESIEYYTALNNIENRAISDDSKYEDGTDKAKFGIIGEGFRNFNIADYKDPDFNVTVRDDEMGPKLINAPISMKLLSTSNVLENDRTLTLNYTETTMVSQPVTSNKLISVQPFLFAEFIGDCTLFPEMDFWVSEELKPEVIKAPPTQDAPPVIKSPDVIRDRCEEGPIRQTAVPTISAISLISLTPGGDPPAVDASNTAPVLNPQSSPVIPSVPHNSIILGCGFPIDNIDEVVPVVPPPPPVPPPAPPTSLPVYVTPVRPRGGGGCVTLESFIPWIDMQMFNGKKVDRAYQIRGGHKILLSSPTEMRLGSYVDVVKDVAVEVQPCVRILTKSDVALVCSTSAPIPTSEKGIMKAPYVLGEKVAVYKDGMQYWDEVVNVESVGELFVRPIDANGQCFWAGEKENAYILHHNARLGMTQIQKV